MGLFERDNAYYFHKKMYGRGEARRLRRERESALDRDLANALDEFTRQYSREPIELPLVGQGLVDWAASHTGEESRDVVAALLDSVGGDEIEVETVEILRAHVYPDVLAAVLSFGRLVWSDVMVRFGQEEAKITLLRGALQKDRSTSFWPQWRQWLSSDPTKKEWMAADLIAELVGLEFKPLVAMSDRAILGTSELWDTSLAVTYLSLDGLEMLAEVSEGDVAEVAATYLERLHQGRTGSRGGGGDIYDQLRKLGELRDAGILSHDEFETKKQELLKRL